MGNEYAEYYRPYFQQIQSMPGASRKFKHIRMARTIEDLCDYLAEFNYALLFANLKFHVEIEPLGKKGPDLKVSRDNSYAYVEVMRFRLIHPEAVKGPISMDNKTIKEEWDKAFDKIRDKVLKANNEPTIIVIWNDEALRDRFEVGLAAADLISGARNQLSSLRGILFITCGSRDVQTLTQKQFYCFPLQVQSGTPPEQWMHEIANSNSINLVPSPTQIKNLKTKRSL